MALLLLGIFNKVPLATDLQDGNELSLERSVELFKFFSYLSRLIVAPSLCENTI